MEISGPIAVIEQDKPQSNGRWPKGVSGNPSGSQVLHKRASELFDAMAGDFGTLSAVNAALLRQACLLLARSERVKRIKDADAAIRMSGEARRLLATVRGLSQQAAAPHVPLRDRLAAEAAGEAV